MSWKKMLVGLVWAVAVASWVAVTAFYFTGPSLKEWTVAVTAAAVLSEIAFWTTAAVLGITLWESRKAVFRFLTRPFRRNR